MSGGRLYGHGCWDDTAEGKRAVVMRYSSDGGSAAKCRAKGAMVGDSPRWPPEPAEAEGRVYRRSWACVTRVRVEGKLKSSQVSIQWYVLWWSFWGREDSRPTTEGK